jgi:hypothetical protein
LKNLKPRRILEIYDEQVSAADKDDIRYSDFVTPGACCSFRPGKRVHRTPAPMPSP